MLDEPTSSLDPAVRYEVLNLIDRLRGQVTVFLSSHILQDVERICDTIGIIHRGELILVAERDELLNKYPVNVVELEIDHECLPIPNMVLSSIEEQSWITTINQEDNKLRITVSDPMLGKKLLIPLITDQGLILERYEWVRPSLEEIFLKISS